jgi:spore germination protein GerM
VRRFGVLVATSLLLVAACAREPEVRFLPAAELPQELYNPGQNPGTELRMARALIYVVQTDEEGTPVRPARLGVLARELETDRPTAEFAMRQLLMGPTSEEQQAFRTAIPPGTELLGVSVERGVADLNLSAQFEAAGAELLHLLRVAQVVWTLTELPDVDSVRFRIHGAPRPVVDQNGVAHERLGRGRYSRFAPPEGDAGMVGGSVAPEAGSSP